MAEIIVTSTGVYTSPQATTSYSSSPTVLDWVDYATSSAEAATVTYTGANEWNVTVWFYNDEPTVSLSSVDHTKSKDPFLAPTTITPVPAELSSSSRPVGFFAKPALVVGVFGSITIALVLIAVFITILVMKRKRRRADDAKAEDQEKLAPNGSGNNRRYSISSSIDGGGAGGSIYESPLQGGANEVVLVRYPDSAYAPSTYSNETLQSDGRTPARSSTYAQQLQHHRHRGASPLLGQVDEERVSLRGVDSSSMKTASTIVDSIYAPAPPYMVTPSGPPITYDEDPFRRESCASS